MTAEKKQKKKPGLFGFFAMPEGEEVTIYRAKHGVDIPFLITVMLLLCFGSVMIFSSSYVFAEKKIRRQLFLHQEADSMDGGGHYRHACRLLR